MEAITAAHDGDIQMIDSTSVRAHQQAATAKKAGADRCLGRSRGGLTTKIHVVVDAQGLPIRLGLTAGQTHDGHIADTLLDHLGPRTIVLPRADPGPRCHAQHPAQEQPALEALLQQAALPRAQPDRAVLLQAEALPPRRDSLRQARNQLPRNGPARLNAPVATRL
jgi:transposase